MTLRKVANISEAIDIINENGSHHTDCIVTSDPEKSRIFYELSRFRRGVSQLFHQICRRLQIWDSEQRLVSAHGQNCTHVVQWGLTVS